MMKNPQSDMATQHSALAAIDTRSFFEQALAYGIGQGILEPVHLDKIREAGPKGIVQIANYFDTAYLQASLEVAAVRMVNLISLFLADKSGSNLHLAAVSLRDNSLLSHSKGGSDMLKRLHALPTGSLLELHATSGDEQAFLNERSYAFAMSVDAYRKE
ncbi:hypothetical protein, partial [Craterilacuibacter sp.]|uniref:hypothetical protein n=1 Tax=Craterilacuibacter sp. TaxID=2870909 RepID=UPI003F3F9D56